MAIALAAEGRSMVLLYLFPAFAVSAPARASRSMDCRLYAGWTDGTVSLQGYGSGALSFKTRFGMVHTDLLPMYGEPDNVSALDLIMY